MAKFEDLSEEEQIALLHKAVEQIQQRLNTHVHVKGGVYFDGLSEEVNVSYPD